MKTTQKAILKDTLSLVAITLVAALLLALIFQLTKDQIAKAENEERLESFRVVFSGAEAFYPMNAEKLSAWQQQNPKSGVLEGYETADGEGNRTGLVLSVVSHSGYGGDIVLSAGFKKDGTITGVKVTSMSETSGLGANCTNEKWISQFSGKTAYPIGFVKDGNPGDSEIDAIASATITTKAVLEAVNDAIGFARFYLGISA